MKRLINYMIIFGGKEPHPLYATGLLPPADRKGGFEARVTTFKKARANILLVSLLDGAKRVEFMHTEDALICIVPELDAEVAGLPYTLKLERVLQRSFCLAVVAAIVSITERGRRTGLQIGDHRRS